MPNVRKPPRARLSIPELQDLGRPAAVEQQIRDIAPILGIQRDSADADALAQLATSWVVQYWTWRTQERHAPSAASEALLLEGILRRIEKAVAECGLSVDTDRALVGCAATLEHRIGVLRSTPTRTGPKRDRARTHLAPALLEAIEQRWPSTTRAQRKRFAKEAFAIAGVTADPDNHPGRLQLEPPTKKARRDS